MFDPYEGVIVIPVSIPAEIIEGEMAGSAYEEVEEKVLAQAEYELQGLIVQFREANRG